MLIEDFSTSGAKTVFSACIPSLRLLSWLIAYRCSRLAYSAIRSRCNLVYTISTHLMFPRWLVGEMDRGGEDDCPCFVWGDIIVRVVVGGGHNCPFRLAYSSSIVFHSVLHSSTISFHFLSFLLLASIQAGSCCLPTTSLLLPRFSQRACTPCGCFRH